MPAASAKRWSAKARSPIIASAAPGRSMPARVAATMRGAGFMAPWSPVARTKGGAGGGGGVQPERLLFERLLLERLLFERLLFERLPPEWPEWPEWPL